MRRRAMFGVAIATASVVAILPGCSSDDATTQTASTPSVTLSDQLTIDDLLTRDGQFEPLLAVVRAAGPATVLRESGPVTLLAPDRAAFASLTPQQRDELATSSAAALRFMQQHTLDGNYSFDQLRDRAGSTVTNLAGESLPVTLDGSSVLVGGATISKRDITASNGTLHVVTEVVAPE